MSVIHLIEILAVIASALYGILLANRKHFDFVGVFSIAFAVAFMGGTLRDLFLNRHPLFWIANDHLALAVFGLAIVGASVPKLVGKLERHLYIPDALGLGLYSITGASYALEGGTSFFIASLMGVVTGTFGGVTADVICNEIPSLFRPTPLYATCAFVGTWVYLLGINFEFNATGSMLAGVVVIFTMRMIAVRMGITLPNRQAGVA